jgi:formylglycine-generating enzyme required for sulfatase activity
MKSHSLLTISLAASLSTSTFAPVFAAEPFVYETVHEFFASGDFDGDGRLDTVIVDKETGKYRLGYQLADGQLTWVDCRPSNIRGVTGFTVGKLLAAGHEAFAFTTPDANQISIVDASTPTTPPRPITVPFSAGLGPNVMAAVKSATAGKDDLFVGSIYNSPEPNAMMLLRTEGAEYPKMAEEQLPGAPAKANRFSVKPGGPELVCELVTDDKGNSLRIEDLGSGKPVVAASATGLAAGSDYAVGNFGAKNAAEIIFYKPGENNLKVSAVEESGGKYQLGKQAAFDLKEPVQSVFVLSAPKGQKLFVIFGKGEKAGLFDFDGVKEPALVQTIVSTNEVLTGAASLGDGLVAFSHPSDGKFSTRYLAFKSSGAGYTFNAFGGLSSLADNDNMTIPDIQDRIAANTKVKAESEMQPYTNTIPGTTVKYSMVPIHGGEFVMGSPDAEANRKPDEGPQHKVKISPFWMQKFEITWNEYELFMYPDEEKRTRESIKSDSSGDKLADAVTHPSKPYVEMSFGMGKDGFPAIAMTQHAANKYCQWLSAKTGEFYRLPTEAEWEYACRAGTTTTYYFGEDSSKLPEYAWFEQNSDFKYQKVGKKKPNPWGLYDMYGNVTEWVLDQYDPDFYKKSAGQGTILEPWNKATQPYPHAVRGGSWDDEAVMCRSAARRGSERAWKMQDPQLPKSVWFFSDAQFVGFRMVRPLVVPTAEQMQKYWTSGVERD